MSSYYHYSKDSSGLLAGLIDDILRGFKIKNEELELIKAYVIQYAIAQPNTPRNLMLIKFMNQTQLVDYVHLELEPLGIDPF